MTESFRFYPLRFCQHIHASLSCEIHNMMYKHGWTFDVLLDRLVYLNAVNNYG